MKYSKLSKYVSKLSRLSYIFLWQFSFVISSNNCWHFVWLSLSHKEMSNIICRDNDKAKTCCLTFKKILSVAIYVIYGISIKVIIYYSDKFISKLMANIRSCKIKAVDKIFDDNISTTRLSL